MGGVAAIHSIVIAIHIKHFSQFWKIDDWIEKQPFLSHFGFYQPLFDDMEGRKEVEPQRVKGTNLFFDCYS